MKRFDSCFGNPMAEMPEGEFVMYSQAAAIIQLANEKAEAAEQRATALERERDQLQRQLNFAVLLINRRRDATVPPRRENRGLDLDLSNRRA